MSATCKTAIGTAANNSSIICMTVHQSTIACGLSPSTGHGHAAICICGPRKNRPDYVKLLITRPTRSIAALAASEVNHERALDNVRRRMSIRWPAIVRVGPGCDSRSIDDHAENHENLRGLLQSTP